MRLLSRGHRNCNLTAYDQVGANHPRENPTPALLTRPARHATTPIFGAIEVDAPRANYAAC
jgi:hypothetical protein